MEETKTGATDDEVAVEETENSDTEVAETEGTEAVEETEETETGTEAAETEVTETEAAETEKLEIVDEVRNATAAEDFSYEENEDGTITITDYTGSDTAVVIPETINGKSVTSIGDNAFYGCKGLTSIELPSSVTSIGKNVFGECVELASIVVDVENPVYNSGAGSNCIIETETNTLIMGCKNTTIPSSVTSIRDYAFCYCSSLTSIDIPSSVTSIGDSAFSDCSGLTSIELPSGVTSIGDGAFSECSGLTSIELPSSVTSIGDSAFSWCSNLTGIEIPSSVTSIGDDAFGKCDKLTIYCYEGSYAKQYAIDHGIPYQLKVAYTVKFNGNGADSGSVANQKITYGSKTALSANKFQKKGYSFKGWNTKKDGTGTTYADKADGSKLTKTNGATVTLYAQWTANKYTITFNGNGSTSGSMKKLTSLKYGKTYTLTKNSYKKKGYTFKGWNTKKDGNGKTYKNKAEIKNLSAKSGGKVTLYAKWSKTKYTITYNLNKGKNNKNNSSSYNITTKTIKLKSPTRKGYTFKGWYSDKKCTKKVTQIKKGSTGNKTLYAKWTAHKYTIKFDGNGSTSGSMDKLKNRKYGKTYTLTANAYKKKGYKFVGWNTKKDGSGKSYKNKAQVKNLTAKSGKTVTLYAQWKKK